MILVKIFNGFVWVAGIVTIALLGILIRCLVKNQDTNDIWDCLRRSNFTTPSDPKPSGSKKVMCEIEGEDLFNAKVYTRDGKLVTSQPDKLTCDECTKYVYKEGPGECYDLGFDETYQSKNYVVGVCSASLTKKSCPF